jgi:3-oxoacyl-[acyl-carrier-protein] synthase-3
MRNAYITEAGAYLPGEPVDNDHIEDHLGRIGGKRSRLKDRVLRSNKIRQRHYALLDGVTTELNEELAAKAVQDALSRRGMKVEELEMLATGTTQPDCPVPGFASMVHGRLGGAPMELLSAGGVCASAMAALSGVTRAVRTGQKRRAAVVGSEQVSRFLKASRFEKEGTLEGKGGSLRQFDADFLRWMLSDGAGAVILEDQPRKDGLSLRVDWVELVSYAHEFETCMYAGLGDKKDPRPGVTWLDYPTIAMAEHEGITKLRQDTRMLPNLVKLGVEEYARLVQQERVSSEKIAHVLCHFSSDFFREQLWDHLKEAKLFPAEEKWFSNLYTKGNTGAASIFIMLEEALHDGRFKAGEEILLSVPESGRFTMAYAKLTAVGPDDDAGVVAPDASERRALRAPSANARREALDRDAILDEALERSPLAGDVDPNSEDEVTRYLAVELALVWADFERMLRQTPLLERLNDGSITVHDYQRLLVNLRQQVMEGARWIARAASSVSIELFEFRSMFISHAGDEHRDYQMIERDFVATGGELGEILTTPKNIGSEAFSAYMFHQAGLPDPINLIGAMFIIEGLGKMKAREWSEQLKEHLGLDDKQVTFLAYHGANDEDHYEKLREVIRSGIIDMPMAERVVKTARTVARLYALQLEEIDHV